MDSKQPPQTPTAPATDIGERIAHIESKMDFVATRDSIALVRTEMANMNADLRTEIEGTRTEIEGTRTEMANTTARIAELKADLLTGIAEVKTLVATREASMQRWLLGITGTAMIGVTTALVRTFV